MAVLILIACLSLALMALAMRRALPIAAGATLGWIAFQTAYDPLAACVAGITMITVCSACLDNAALSHRTLVRLSVRILECIAGALVAVLFAWWIACGLDGAGTIASSALLLISAAILGGLITMSRYQEA
jgi:hypothetical protein